MQLQAYNVLTKLAPDFEKTNGILQLLLTKGYLVDPTRMDSFGRTALLTLTELGNDDWAILLQNVHTANATAAGRGRHLPVIHFYRQFPQAGLARCFMETFLLSKDSPKREPAKRTVTRLVARVNELALPGAWEMDWIT